MTWEPQEWDAFCSLLEEGWPGVFSESTAEAWRVLLDATPPQTAVTALRRLLLEGRRFRPSVSELLAATRHDPSRPTFDEALVLIRRALTATFGERDALERLSHPLVRSFVQRQGVDRLRMFPLDDPVWGEKHRRDLEGAWDRHVEAFDGREIAALASGSGDLRRLDPLAPRGELTA